MPELEAPAAGIVEPPEVAIRLGQPAPTGSPGGIAVSPRRCRITLPGVARYDVRDGREIVVRAEIGGRPDAVRLGLLASAWGALLGQRGALALHAGVVRRPGGEALAFCGASGAGKSSMVAMLLRRGFALVSDDLSRVETTDGERPRVWPSAPRLKLTSETAGILGWSDRSTTLADEKLHVPWSGPRAEAPLPLGQVYVLAWGEPRVRRLRGAEAARAVLAHATYRPQFVSEPPASARHWAQCLAVARHVPVLELRRPRDWQRSDEALTLAGLEP